MLFGYSILATAILLSLTAAYYSVAGLTAIFAAATIPIIIMGGSLELGKIVATVWLHNNWKRIPILFKIYLIPAIAFLMLLTSMGIFGYLSKAHLDQSTTTGDSSAQVQIYEDQIKIEKDNIEAARAALKQMDATINLTMDRSTDAGSVRIASNMRKRQTKERTELQEGILKAQKEITRLQGIKAPLAKEARKIEAEVGPIKYIAALMYGDNPDSNLLERAVRWVIIMIVLVFDPLALCLILSANLQLDWARHGKAKGFAHDDKDEDTPRVVPARDAIVGHMGYPLPQSKEDITPFFNGEMASNQVPDQFNLPVPLVTPPMPPVKPPRVDPLEEIELELVPVERIPEISEPLPEIPLTMLPEPLPELVVVDVDPTLEKDALNNAFELIEVDEPAIEPIAQEQVEEPEEIEEVIAFTTQSTPGSSVPTLVKHVIPELAAVADDGHPAKADFGTEFPADAAKGDMYLRVDFLPARLHKFNGTKWMAVDKSTTDSYTYNEEYVKYLVEKLNSGEYSVDDLTDAEQDQIEEFLKK